ncbi:MAG: DUF5693 family protein [Candidatus Eremiobacteraeota bacterium]|nr:DUF5693 family protein [Candidatus Eremiobacteraeota bacterium]
MIKYKKGFFALLIVLAFISSLIILSGRIREEKINRTVNFSMDYNSLVDLCREEGISTDDALKVMKESGITSIAFQEITLDRLHGQGELQWMTGSQLEGLLNLTRSPDEMGDFKINSSGIYVLNCSPQIRKTILDNARLLVGKDMVKEINIPSISSQSSENPGDSVPALEIRGNAKEIPFMGLGVDRFEINKVNRMGFKVVLRPENHKNLSKKEIRSYLEELGKIPSTTCIIFGGTNEALGYPLNLDATVKGLKASGLSFGDIEAPNIRAKQKGATYIAQRMIDRVVRVQSISPLYLAKMKPENAIDIFRLGVRERNIRLLYLRPYPTGIDGKSVLETNAIYFTNLKKEIEKYGFKTGKASRFPDRKPSMLLVIFISLGTAGLFLLFLEQFYHDRGYVAAVVLIIAVLFPAVLIATGKLHWAQKLIGLTLGVLFPVYAISAFFEEMEFIQTENKLSKVLAYSLSMFLKISLITILGGLMLGALFSSTQFMLSVDVVRGVKVLLFLPPILCVLIYYIRGSNRRQTFTALMKTPLYIWQVVVLGILGALGLVYMMRSGNVNSTMASSSERQLRVMMEELMWVRPRFKDFMIGHPALILVWARSYMHNYAGMGILVIFAAVGQADIMDTFAHVHTPLFISLVRIVNGMILGAVIGTLAVVAYWFARKMAK